MRAAEENLGMIRIMLISLVLATAIPPIVQADQPDAQQEGIAAAQSWLGLVDRHQYADSWKEAADYFRNAVAQQEWIKTMEGARAPLGDMVSRTLDSATYQTSLPGAPDGEYVIVTFQTEFQNKKEAVETVVPMKEEDGSWRVSGYFIR
jgi:hypothetical protein